MKACPRILIVDDNEANRALAAATLEGEDYELELCSSGPEAIAAFTARAPDCILLDIRMPGMTGIEVCEKIRALPGGAETPIVFLTAQRDVDIGQRRCGRTRRRQQGQVIDEQHLRPW